MTVEKQAELRRRAETVLGEARATADEAAFARIVARHSEDQATRYRGGDLGWLVQGSASADPAVVEALFALQQPGQFAPLVQGARGFYVAKLLEKREAGRKPLAEVKEAIRYQLSRQKAEQAERDFFAAMKQGLDIHINHALLESISLPAEKNAPPRMPGAATTQAH
jgi:peptidyl-prolyl cis-trans isomerase D